MTDRWEYKSILCDGGDKMEEILIPLGEAGWEAVGFATVQLGATQVGYGTVGQWTAQKYRILLKRRKQ